MSGRTGFDDVLVLLLEFFHSNCTCTTCALVRGNANLLDVGNLFDGVKNHNHHDGGAVGVCDNAATAVFSLVERNVASVHFGNDQGNIVHHTEVAGVVHNYSAVFNSDRSKFLRNCCTCRGENQVHALECISAGQFNLQLFTLEGVFLTDATFRSEELEVLEREVALFQDGKQFLADGTGGAHDGYVTNHSVVDP